MRHVLRLAKKWFWVIIIAILIGGAAGLVVNFFQPKMYEATTILYVSAPNHSDYQGVLGAQQAAKAFASLPTSDDVLKATLHTVNVPGLSLSQLNSRISANYTVDTQFVQIKLRDSDPQRAARLVSEDAKQSIIQFAQSQTANAQTKQFIERQMATLEAEIKSLEQQLAEIQGATPTPQQGTSINQLSTRLNNDQLAYTQLLTSYATINGFQVTIVQQAKIPQAPVGLGLQTAIAMGMLAALIVIVCVILFIEQTNRIPVFLPGDSIAVLDEKTGFKTVSKVKDLATIEKPETESVPTMKSPKLLPPKQAGSQTIPETPADSAAFNHSEDQKADGRH